MLRIRAVERGPAFRLARKSFLHGRDRLSPEGPERSGGPAQRVDSRARPCAEVNAFPSAARAFNERSDRPLKARISLLLALLDLLVLIYLYVVLVFDHPAGREVLVFDHPEPAAKSWCLTTLPAARSERFSGSMDAPRRGRH